MVSQTLYDILEVSEIASQNTIRAARDRLSAQWDPALLYNKDAEARAHYLAIRNAYATLGNPRKRTAYDRKLRGSTRRPVTKKPKLAYITCLGLVAALSGAYHYSDKQGVPQIIALRTPASEKPAAAQKVETPATAETGLARKREQGLQAKPARLSDSPGLKLDTEFASAIRQTSRHTTLK